MLKRFILGSAALALAVELFMAEVREEEAALLKLAA